MGHVYAKYVSKNLHCKLQKKCQKNKNFTVSVPGETPLKIKQTPKSQTISILHLLPYYYWHAIAVLQKCADGTASV